MKDLLKLLAPYLTAIGSAIAVYANFQTELGIMKYRQDSMEERTKGMTGSMPPRATTGRSLVPSATTFSVAFSASPALAVSRLVQRTLPLAFLPEIGAIGGRTPTRWANWSTCPSSSKMLRVV